MVQNTPFLKREPCQSYLQFYLFPDIALRISERLVWITEYRFFYKSLSDYVAFSPECDPEMTEISFLRKGKAVKIVLQNLEDQYCATGTSGEHRENSLYA